LVEKIGCPTVAPTLGSRDKWFETMKLDKKATAGKIKFVVLDKIGEAKVQGAPQELVALVLKNTTSPDVVARTTSEATVDAPKVAKAKTPETAESTVVDSADAAAEMARRAQVARDAGAGTGRTGGIYGVDGVRPDSDD
jgi:3-dehydroquinate synthase